MSESEDTDPPIYESPVLLPMASLSARRRRDSRTRRLTNVRLFHPVAEQGDSATDPLAFDRITSPNEIARR